MSKGRGWGREEGKREGDKRVWRGREGGRTGRGDRKR